jgi:hypothetical protein
VALKARTFHLLGWALMAIAGLAMVIFRRHLASWVRARIRRWHENPDAQRLWERSILFGGIGVGVLSLCALYVAIVVVPGAEQMLAKMKAVTPPPQTTAGLSL